MMSPAATALRPSPWRAVVAGGVLVVAVFVTYWPALRAGFIWDDHNLLTNNPAIVGSRGLATVWTGRAADICPLTITLLWTVYRVAGLTPWPYHLTNVALHAVGTVLLWRALARLRVPGAWWGAALWALHPVQAESVAWVSETKNTLSGVFYLAAVIFWLRRLDSGPPWSIAAALICAVLAMAAKTSAMVLPATILLSAWWMNRGGQRLREAGYFLLPSLAAGALSIWTQASANAANSLSQAGMMSGWQRLAASGDALWFYLGKLLWPHPLSMVYPCWQIDPAQLTAYAPLLAAGVVGVMLWVQRESPIMRGLRFASTYFVAALIPVLGVVNISYYRHSYVADHFIYLAAMGPLALAGAGLGLLGQRVRRSPTWLPVAVGTILLVALGTLSWQRAGIYRNEEILWTDVLKSNPACWAAHNSLSLIAQREGHLDNAVRERRLAMQADPTAVENYNNLGNTLLLEGKPAEAITAYREALRLRPQHLSSRLNLGNTLAALDRNDEAMGEFRRALETTPDSVLANQSLGNALLKQGNVEAAICAYQEAARLEPNDADIRLNLGNALLQAGQADAAIREYQEALRHRPEFVPAHQRLAATLLKKGRTAEAVDEYRRVLQSRPADARAHDDLGAALAVAGDLPGHLEQAMAEYREALRLKPGDRAAQEGLDAVEAMARLSQENP